MKMVSGQQLYLLTLLLYSTTGTGEEVTKTATTGDNYFLPCLAIDKYNTLKMDVNWMHNGTEICTYSIAKHRINIYKCSSDISVNISGITINVTRYNAGLYNCSLMRLTPPPVTHLEDSTVMLQIEAGLILELINSTDLSCIELFCSLDSWSLEELNFTWTTAYQQIHYHDNTMNSIWKLCKPNWTTGDTVTCHASNPAKNLHYSRSITITTSSPVDSVPTTSLWLIIVPAVSSCVGLIFIIFLAVAIHRCAGKKRNAENDMVIVSNKIYANFTLSTISPSNVSSTETRVRPVCRPNPQRICQSQNVECIYEN